MGGHGLENDVIATTTNDIAHANRDRDLRFWPFLNAIDVGAHQMRVRIVEFDGNSTYTLAYNKSNPAVQDREGNVVYLLAHRGHMRYTKQVRLAAETQWGKWRLSSGEVIDLEVLHWCENMVATGGIIGGMDARRCRHFADLACLVCTTPA